MLEAIIWGLIQGLTEFLPISSSGHLVLIPALMGLEPPSLATSAVLHLGTLFAVIAYYRTDLAAMLHFRTDRRARKTIVLLLIGTVPAVGGILVKDAIEDLQESMTAVSIALIVTGIILWLSAKIPTGGRTTAHLTATDAILIGAAQALAIVPGISRSGMTITAGLGRSMDRKEAARFSFLLGIPAIAGAGALEALDLAGTSAGIPGTLWLGVVVAALSGYGAIALLLRVLVSRGLRPFAYYAVIAGIVGLVAI